MEVLRISETAKLLEISAPSVVALINAGLIPDGIMYGLKRGKRLIKTEVLKYKEMRDQRKTQDEIRAYWLAQSANEGYKAA